MRTPGPNVEGGRTKRLQTLRRTRAARDDRGSDREKLHDVVDLDRITFEPAVVYCGIVHGDEATEALTVGDRQLNRSNASSTV